MEVVIKENYEMELLSAIENYLISIRATKPVHNIYFSDHIDLPDKLCIGVISSNEIEACVIIYLVNIMVTDGYSSLFNLDRIYYHDEEDDEKVIFKEKPTDKIIIKDFVEQLISNINYDKYSLDDTFVNTYKNMNGVLIDREDRKTIDDVEIWTFSQIMSHFRTNYWNERYVQLYS
jgi:hypothetical protein